MKLRYKERTRITPGPYAYCSYFALLLDSAAIVEYTGLASLLNAGLLVLWQSPPRSKHCVFLHSVFNAGSHSYSGLASIL